ncbi:MAG: hypothetical protein EA405_03075 [Rhodospirillales bacterium]|nr:MAG: hypothetical protein EA405_03075 [Rhodospirillales bacterium]
MLRTKSNAADAVASETMIEAIVASPPAGSANAAAGRRRSGAGIGPGRSEQDDGEDIGCPSIALH